MITYRLDFRYIFAIHVAFWYMFEVRIAVLRHITL